MSSGRAPKRFAMYGTSGMRMPKPSTSMAETTKRMRSRRSTAGLRVGRGSALRRTAAQRPDVFGPPAAQLELVRRPVRPVPSLMSRHHDGAAARAGDGQSNEHVLARRAVQACEGLIEQQQRRLADQGASKQGASQLTIGKLAERTGREGCDIERCEPRVLSLQMRRNEADATLEYLERHAGHDPGALDE